jgi:hypothetical protein
MWNTAATVQSLHNQDPMKFSDNTVQTFHTTMKAVDVQLQKGVLLSVEHQALQTKLCANYNKAKSRKSTHKGGASVGVSQLQMEIKAK